MMHRPFISPLASEQRNRRSVPEGARNGSHRLPRAALAGGNISSFTVAGRDSLPAEPGGWLSSPLALATAELVSSTATEPETRTSLRELTEGMPVVSLRRIAPPGFLSQSFAADGTGCTS